MPTDDGPLTLPALVVDTAARFGSCEAIVDSATRLTWQQVDRLRRRAAAAFIAAGVEKGARVALWAPNIWEWIICAMGAQSIGAVLVPINTRFRGAEAADVLRRSRARLLFTLGEFLGTRYPELIADEHLPDLQRSVLLRGAAPDSPAGWERFVAAGEGVSEAEVQRRCDAVQPQDVMDIMFTSGTTGKPKGALLTHYQNLRGYRSLTGLYGLNEHDRFLVIPPFFHSFGYKGGWLSCALRGAAILPALTFDLDQLLPLIQRERVSFMPAPPTVYQGLLDHPARDRFDLSSLRMAKVASSTIPAQLIGRLYDELKFSAVFTGYGLTENSGLGVQTRMGDGPQRVAHSAGKPMPDMEMRCADGEGRTLPPGEAGEILIRGYTVMQGYLDDPDQTAQAIDADGWLHTGDIGSLDESGYLKVTGRLKDMYIVGGFNCYPAEIEGMLLAMPGVAQAAVIGIPDPRLGEVGKAFIIAAPGAQLTEAGVIAWARQHMANFKVPRQVQFVEALPLNASGKVMKSELQARGRAAGDASSPQ